MRKFVAVFFLFALTACNSVYVKPHTMESGTTVYAVRGGYGMKRSIKQELENRGFNVIVGRATKMGDVSGEDIVFNDKDDFINAKYVINVNERSETFMPYWCMFNGFWWWSFTVSVAEQKTGKEILSWRGRGCQNSSMRKLDKILDELIKQ